MLIPFKIFNEFVYKCDRRYALTLTHLRKILQKVSLCVVVLPALISEFVKITVVCHQNNMSLLSAFYFEINFTSL